MTRRIALIIAALTMAAPAYAETLYVSDRLATALRATFADDSPLIKTVEVGTPLEVIERVDKFAHVRDQQGSEGWIDVRYLASAVPARMQLDRLQPELAKVRKDLVEAQGRIKELEAGVAQQTARTAELTQAAAEKPVETTNPVPAPTTDADTDVNWGWLVLAFAMLWLGFGVGVVWLRERNRKKLGGMYLRI